MYIYIYNRDHQHPGCAEILACLLTYAVTCLLAYLLAYVLTGLLACLNYRSCGSIHAVTHASTSV